MSLQDEYYKTHTEYFSRFDTEELRKALRENTKIISSFDNINFQNKGVLAQGRNVEVARIHACIISEILTSRSSAALYEAQREAIEVSRDLLKPTPVVA